MNAQVARFKRIGITNMSISSMNSTHQKERNIREVVAKDLISSSRLMSMSNEKTKWIDIKKHLFKCSKIQILSDDKETVEYELGRTSEMIRKMADPSLVQRLSSSKFPHEQHTTKELQERAAFATTKFYGFNSVFRAFVEASMSIGKHDNALKKFCYIKDMLDAEVLDISSYHSILKCIARIGDIDELRNTWSIMVEKDKLLPDELCFVYAFQCIGTSKKLNEINDLEKAKFFESSMIRQKFSFDEIIHAKNPQFQGCDRSLFLEGIRLLNPNFVPKPVSSKPKFYNNELLIDLESRDTSKLQSAISKVKPGRQIELALQKQFELETRGYLDIPSLSQKELTEEEIQQNKKEIASLCNQWTDILNSEIHKKLEVMEMKMMEKRGKVDSFETLTFLRVLSVHELSEICIDKVKSILCDSSTTGESTYSPSVSSLQRQLGEAVMKKYHLNIKCQDSKYLEKYKEAIERYLEWNSMPSRTKQWCHRDAFEHITSQMTDGPSLNYTPHVWPIQILIAVGRELLHVIISKLQFLIDRQKQNIHFDTTKRKQVDAFPVLFRIYLRMRKESHFVEEVKPHPLIAKLFSKQKFHTLRFSVNMLPTIIPPCPWTCPTQGGYFMHPTALIRISEEQPSPTYKQTLDYRTQNILPIFDSLNILGSTAWIVNKPILEVASKAFLDQEKYRPYLKKLAIPTDPDLVVIPDMRKDLKTKIRLKKLSTEEKEEYSAYMKEKQLAMQHKSDCNSMWNDIQYRLSIAHEFKDDVCFFPHNIDFRGRVYPIPPHFNHMGGDLVRSMFMFAEGKPLGPEGLRWLKLHAINLTGTMKRKSVAERLIYVESILETIVDSANNPFEGLRWWLESEDPFQTLAACFEIRNALEYGKQPNKSVEDYVCHLPIHQDGSCNGLQHYAALGRDVLGAASVNLIPADTPQDVYSEIASIVERRRSEDETSENEVAKIVKGFVQRKVIKQTVMTTVYGVTKYGAKLQIARQLVDLDGFPRAEKESASKYLAQLTFESLNEMFYASQEIQAWFIECSNSICGLFNKPVEWTTPLGLPVIQPYMKRLNYNALASGKQKDMNLKPLDFNRLLRDGDVTEKPHLMKQRNGFPPNFIHSLDSSHMMLTSLHLWNLGVTYASVHDCYWTHPCNVKLMNEVCREQFIGLHSQPILEDLAESFDANYLLSNPGFTQYDSKTKPISDIETLKAEKLFESVPEKGNDQCALNLNIVKKSVYFFS